MRTQNKAMVRERDCCQLAETENSEILRSGSHSLSVLPKVFLSFFFSFFLIFILFFFLSFHFRFEEFFNKRNHLLLTNKIFYGGLFDLISTYTH